MTNDYIRREDAIKGQKTGTFANGICFEAKACIPVDYIESLEPADVVPVVRCRDCKFRENDDFCTGRGFPCQLVPDDGFCDKGERKE